MSLNKVMLIGNIGIAPELRNTANGNPVVNLSIATEDKWRDKNTGNMMQETEWHRIVVWGNQATACANHLKVGSRVHVEGKLKTRPWTDKNEVEHRTTEIHSTNVIFLGDSKKNQTAADNTQAGVLPAAIMPVDQATIDLATKMAAQMIAQQNAGTIAATPSIPDVEEAYTDDMPEDVPF